MHSFAEGLAVGGTLLCKFLLNLSDLESLQGTGNSLGYLVVIAIIIHKAPEAIGFGSFLTSRNISNE
jgi:zinc transporter ZupT